MFGEHTTLYVGVDFLASAADVKVSYPSPDVSPEYAYLFLSPDIKLTFNSTRTLHHTAAVAVVRRWIRGL